MLRRYDPSSAEATEGERFDGSTVCKFDCLEVKSQGIKPAKGLIRSKRFMAFDYLQKDEFRCE